MVAFGQEILCYTDLLGHARAKVIVGRAIKTNRVPHAYLFKGPDGVGKKLFARGLATALNCRARKDGVACGTCSSCVKMRAGTHPDYLVVEPEKGAIKIDQVRKVCRELSYAPYESANRVVVLEDVHTMRQEAANSLLKTLEEPPENNILILTSESSADVLTTVASRCQVVPFYGLSDEQTRMLLGESLTVLAHSEQKLLARLAEGSPGRGLLLADMGLLSIWKRLQELLLAASQNKRDILALLDCAENIANLKDDIVSVFAVLRLWLRDHLFARHGVSGQLFTLADWDATGRSLTWNIEQLHEGLSAVDQAELELGYNCNATLVCEVLLFKLMEK